MRTRVIPCLLLKNEALVKTVKFDEYNYIGDPVNTVRIFNELEVDELIFLDISATKEKHVPNFKLLESIANECFMPLAYGGGIRSLEDVKRILASGFEKVVLNSELFSNPSLVTEITDVFGSQCLVASLDYRKNFFSRNILYSHGGIQKQSMNLIEWAKEVERLGAGEIILTSIDRDGTWAGYDIDTIKEVAANISIPLIASGGAGTIEDLALPVKLAGASAVAVGSLVVYQKKNMGVLVNFPDKTKLKEVFS